MRSFAKSYDTLNYQTPRKKNNTTPKTPPSNHFEVFFPIFFLPWLETGGMAWEHNKTPGVKAGECAPAINLLYDMPGAADQWKGLAGDFKGGELKRKYNNFGLPQQSQMKVYRDSLLKNGRILVVTASGG